MTNKTKKTTVIISAVILTINIFAFNVKLQSVDTDEIQLVAENKEDIPWVY